MAREEKSTPRIEPLLPEPLEAIIARDRLRLRTSRTHYFEIAAAFMVGYQARREDDAAELRRLSEWAAQAERRLDAAVRMLGIDRRRLPQQRPRTA
jgi:hypothetical protein